MQIKGTTRVCGLIGNPVAHSLSPFIHNKLAQGMGIDLAYVTFKVDGDKVSQAVNGAYALDIMGMNVTVPHKQAVMDPIVEIDPLILNFLKFLTLTQTNLSEGYFLTVSFTVPHIQILL